VFTAVNVNQHVQIGGSFVFKKTATCTIHMYELMLATTRKVKDGEAQDWCAF
jgi:hypothetical protein